MTVAKERAGSAVKGNGFDPKQAKIWQDQYEKQVERLLELQMDYLAECKEVREEMKEVLDRAKDAGIPKRVIKATSQIRALERRISRIESDGEAEDIETLEQFRHALGDLDGTPLGDAAAEKKAKGMPGADAPSSMN